MNLLESVPVTTFAKGCFLEGSMVATPNGQVAIELLKPGDEIISFNEATQQEEISVIGDIDVLEKDHHWIINRVTRVTGEHPMYTQRGIVEVEHLTGTDVLVGRNNNFDVNSLTRKDGVFTVYNLLDVTPNHNYYVNNLLVHNKGCFVGDTLISTPSGEKKISELEAGDEVISYNEVTKEKETSIVRTVDVLEERGLYTIDNIVTATGDHPFYTTDGIKKVRDLKVGDKLYIKSGATTTIRNISYADVESIVYNLLDVEPNNNYYANGVLVHNKGGGGCFLAGTAIETPKGTVSIEDIEAGDEILSLNESTKKIETSTVERLDVLGAREYYTLNHEVNVTAEHPFYIFDQDSNRTAIKKVGELKVGDILIDKSGTHVPLRNIRIHKQDVVIYNLINVTPNHNYFAAGYLVHNKGGIGGGARSSGGAKSSGTSKSTSSSSSSSKPAAPKAGVSTAKPGSAIRTADGKTVVSSTAKPAKPGFSTNSKGIVGDNGYTPRFTNGYNAPPGSVVYYRDTSALDYLPWIYLFSQDNPATPQGQTATVVQPDGKQIEAKPVAQGTDGLAILNWIILILLITAIIGGIIWGVNKLTNKDKPKPKTPRYGGYGSYY